MLVLPTASTPMINQLWSNNNQQTDSQFLSSNNDQHTNSQLMSLNKIMKDPKSQHIVKFKNKK